VAAVADAKTAAMKPDENRSPFAAAARAGPNIEIETIFRHRFVASDAEH
jgi:hypothetical protein